MCSWKLQSRSVSFKRCIPEVAYRLPHCVNCRNKHSLEAPTPQRDLQLFSFPEKREQRGHRLHIIRPFHRNRSRPNAVNSIVNTCRCCVFSPTTCWSKDTARAMAIQNNTKTPLVATCPVISHKLSETG